MKSTFPLILFGSFLTIQTQAAEPIIEHIWDMNGRGSPAISVYNPTMWGVRGTVNPYGVFAPTISVVLPAYVLENSKNIPNTVQAFMQRWAPEMCSHITDFQHPHKGLKVTVYVQGQAWEREAVIKGRPVKQRLFTTSLEGMQVTFDYTPSKSVTCTVPDLNMS